MKTATQSVLSIFETVTERQYPDPQAIVRCHFCNEESKAVLIGQNHQLIFNGWCIKAMLFHNRAGYKNPEELSWLIKHGIDPDKSRFDESHWHLENIAKYEARFD